jgi:hypothetical protein
MKMSLGAAIDAARFVAFLERRNLRVGGTGQLVELNGRF